MNNLTATGEIYGETLTLQRVSKRTAKKLFSEGKRVFIQPSNYYPFGAWYNAMEIHEDFDRVSTEYAWYNCDSERGYYPSFYVQVN